MKGKKWLVGVLATLCAATSAVALAGCGDDDNTAQSLSSSSTVSSEETPTQTPSVGLEYTLSSDRTCYSVTGIGTCTDTAIVIPATYEGKPVTSIGDEAFDCCGLTSIVIPDSVTSIGYRAFFYCTSLTNIAVDKNNTVYQSIKGSLYSKDRKTLIQYATGQTATSFTIPYGVASIGDYAFSSCDSLTRVVIPDSVTSIGDYAFRGCDSLTSIVIPDSVTSIGNYAFRDCDSLTSIVIPDSVTSIGYRAFYNCDNLTSVVIGESVTSIGGDAFSSCDSLTSIVIGESVTSIGIGAFSCCGLKSIVIPDSVTSIGERAFSSCDSLTSVVIGDSVTSIGEYAFRDCPSLTQVYYKGTVEHWANIEINYGNNYYLTDATRYYYTKTRPTVSGNFWHYDENGTPVIWEIA